MFIVLHGVIIAVVITTGIIVRITSILVHTQFISVLEFLLAPPLGLPKSMYYISALGPKWKKRGP